MIINSENAIAYSDSDLDGSASRLLFEYFIPGIKVIQSSTVKLRNELTLMFEPHIKNVCFADLAPTRGMYEALLDAGKHVYIFDHHVTSRELLGDIQNQNYIYDVTRCSAKILYDYMMEHCIVNTPSTCLQQYVDLVNVYDLWKDDHADFDKARGLENLLMWYLRESRWKNSDEGYRQFIKSQLKKIEYGSTAFKFYDFEQEVVDIQYKKEKDALFTAEHSHAKGVDSQGHMYGYFELPSKVSYVCGEMLKKFPELDYVICFSTFRKEDNKCSFRSKRIDVRNKAECFMGGGHSFASGLNLSKEIRDGIKKGQFQIPPHPKLHSVTTDLTEK